MLLYELLTKSSDKQAVENLAATFSLSTSETSAILHHVLPAISEAIERNTLSRGGIADLVDLLGTTDYQIFLQPAAQLKSGQTTEAGTEALARLFRTKQQSRIVAARASRATGISETTIKAMLPAIASIVLASLSRQTHASFDDNSKRVAANMRDASAQTPTSHAYNALSTAVRRRNGRLNGKRISTIVRDQFARLFGFENTGILSWLAKRLLTFIVRRVVSQALGRAR